MRSFVVSFGGLCLESFNLLLCFVFVDLFLANEKPSLGVLNVLLQPGYPSRLFLCIKGTRVQEAAFALGKERREEGGTKKAPREDLFSGLWAINVGATSGRRVPGAIRTFTALENRTSWVFQV